MTFSISVLRVHLTRAILLSLTLAINGCGGGGSSSDLPPLSTASDELKEPKVLSSSGGQLDVLMVAHAASVNAFSPYQTTGWVYSICYRPSDGSNQCPSDGSQDNDYGGTRLQINPGDKLKVHLINQLPTAADAKHAQDDGEAFLALNPTNLHTHGLLVSPFYPSQGSSVWGDNVFVYAFNSNNGTPAASQHLHGTVQYDAVDYEYDVPSGHPSGLYWFHPHVHGISGNQITAGLSGLITVGQVADYACQSATCASGLSSVPVRHLMLKDSQVEHNGTLSHDQDSAFCTVDASVGSSSPTHQGGCDGQNQTANGGNDHTGGRWFFTVNGQQFPTVTVGAPSGQIWRITNSSKSATYELNLWQPDEHREIAHEGIVD
jgi:L-ascorbate oxidase